VGAIQPALHALVFAAKRNTDNFSDYQHLTRAFKRLNREVKILLALDRHSEPHRYDELAERIVSGGDRRSLMKSILEE